MRKEGAQGPSGVQGQRPGRRSGDAFFVTECLNLDVLEEKNSKTAKNTIIKNHGRLKGAGASPPPLNTPLCASRFVQINRAAVNAKEYAVPVC